VPERARLVVLRVAPRRRARLDARPAPHGLAHLPRARVTKLAESVGGLAQAAPYEFRLGFLTPNGRESYTPLKRFATAACGVTATPGESFASLMRRLGGNRTACLAPGTYSWGDYVVPAGKTIRGIGAARVMGEARIQNPNVTLADLYLQAAPTRPTRSWT
jgi:hypothetical protein